MTTQKRAQLEPPPNHQTNNVGTQYAVSAKLPNQHEVESLNSYIHPTTK